MVSVISPRLCIRCKGRLWCGLSKCPILEAKRLIKGVNKRELSGYSPPSLLIGWRGYPEVNVTPILSEERSDIAENPSYWAGKLSIEEILDLRMNMGGGSQRRHVKNIPEDTILDIALSKKPIALDVTFKQPPKSSVTFSNLFPPIGFRGELERLEIAENPKIDKRAESLYYDEVKAKDAVIYLYEKGRDVYELSRYLSSGIFGKEKRLVPTRWSITAVDDIISNYLLEKVSTFPPIGRIELYTSSLYDNHFFILFIPGPWAFELVEAWAPKSFWSRGKEIIVSDYEFGRKRKNYASNVGGSYYASKLAVLEKLYEKRRVASVLILREVREGYYAPLGVWQVRENVRHALRRNPLYFDSLRDAYNYILSRSRVKKWKEYSILLKGVQQRII